MSLKNTLKTRKDGEPVTKNEQIKESLKATRARHKNMACRVFEVKVIKNKLSKEKMTHINNVFKEAKWLRNAVLASEDVFSFNRDAKVVQVKVGDVYEERPLVAISSQMKQDVVDSLKSEVRGLATKKAKGERVGRLKFKSSFNSISLRQYGVTYRIDFENNTISIQGMKKPIKVRGLHQITDDMEIANAKFVRKASGLYFHITTYSERTNAQSTGAVVGIDFGIATNLTLDNGDEINICVPETKSVKSLSRKVNRSLVKNGRNKNSRNHKKRKNKLRRAYERQNKQKKDLANKVVSELLRDYDVIAIQDEMIANWHKGLFGKQVQHSAMGSIKAKLKSNFKTRMLEREFPSTQKCPMCGENTKHPLDVRYYLCERCGYYHPSRDQKSAETILAEVLRRAS